MKRKIVAFICGTAVCSIIAGCAGNKGGVSAPKVRNVVTVRAEYPVSASVSSYNGVVKEAHAINVGFKTPGQITALNVKAGDRVGKGQLLATLDDKDYKLGVEALQIQYDQLSDEVGRIKELYLKKSVSANDYEKAEAGLRQLGVQLQVNKNKVEYTRLYAPATGYITSVNFSPSEMVDAGTPVFAMMDVSSLEVQTDIPACDYMDRGAFKSFSCTTAEGVTVPLTLVGIVPKADGNQLYKMTLRASGNNVYSGLMPGANVEVTARKSASNNANSVSAASDTAVAESSGSLTLPLGAIRYDGGQAYVWMVGEDSALTRLNVSVTASQTAENVVVNGIPAGAEVVRAGAATLRQGEKVRVIAAGKSNVGGLL